MIRHLIVMICMVACAENEPIDMQFDALVFEDGAVVAMDVSGQSDYSGADRQLPIQDMALSPDAFQTPVDARTQDARLLMDGALDSTLPSEADVSQLDAMQSFDMFVQPDANAPPVLEDCFPEQINANLSAGVFTSIQATAGSEVCNENAAGELDGDVAELGFTGGAPAIIDGQEVTACVRADFGRGCTLNEHVGILVSSGVVSQACDAQESPSTTQCDVEGLCGTRSGASILLFVALDSADPRFVARVGHCGEGTALNALTPLSAFSGVSDLAGVRYIYACRPSVACGPDAADVSLDALYLIWR